MQENALFAIFCVGCWAALTAGHVGPSCRPSKTSISVINAGKRVLALARAQRCSKAAAVVHYNTWRHLQNLTGSRIKVLQRRQNGTAPWLRTACTKNTVEFGRVIAEICSRIDTQTGTLITIFRSHTRVK